jgi:hypothetical protein
MTLAEKASRSPGWRDVITPWSTTTGAFGQRARAGCSWQEWLRMRWQQSTHRPRKIHQLALTQQYDAHQQKQGQREAENENDALPGPAQNNFAPARLLGGVRWSCAGFSRTIAPRVQ